MILRNFPNVKRKKDIVSILNAGLKAANLQEAVKSALRRLSETKNANRIFVIGFGKGSVQMAIGCEKMLGKRIFKGVVIAPTGVRNKKLKRIKVLEGTHPIPSEINLASTKELLSIVSEAKRDDLVICLISGGGSALFMLPADGISLEDKKVTTDLLLRSGASIEEINIIRKHISKVKGGQLLKFINEARVISLIASDVVGDPVEFIASGPTSPDSSTFHDALRILTKYNLLEKIPESVSKRIKEGAEGKIPETPKPGDKIFEKVKNIVVASNIRSLESMEAKAKNLGYNSKIISSYIQGESREVGKVLSAIVKQVMFYNSPVRKPACLIFGGETTVTVKGKGKGGRNQELVLSVMIELRKNKNFVFASMGSDGIDGYSDAAGAVIDDTTFERALNLGLNPEKYLENNDSYNFFKPLGALIFTGPTGTNVNDFIVTLIF